jgi:hypothetical protein
LLATAPTLVMTDPYRLTGFLFVALLCAALSGAAGTLVAGRWASGRTVRSGFWAGFGTGAVQGLTGGGVAGLLFWALMAVSISGFTLRNPVELSVFMEPDIFMGSFFVSLSAFLYTFAGGLLLAPAFGTLINRAVRASKDAKGETGGKEDFVVR